MAGEEHLGASPTRIASPELRFEAKRALVWACVVGLIALAIYISQSLLVIFGAMVFASMIDGGARLLGRVLPIGRGWRIAIVLLSGVAFLCLADLLCREQISQEAAEFPAIVQEQALRALAWMRRQGFEISLDSVQGMISQAASGFGTVTRALGGILGGLTTLLLVAIIGLYIALEPKLYERGVAWMLPVSRRGEFYQAASRMGFTMRRLMFGRIVGMVVEGIFTYAMLAGYGLVTGDAIPMAALLAILTGLLAFVPNIGAIVSGVLMVLVGFSGGAADGHLYHRRLFHGAEHRWLCDRPDDRPQDGGPRPRAGAGDAAGDGHPVRHSRPVPRRSAAGDDQGGAGRTGAAQ